MKKEHLRIVLEVACIIVLLLLIRKVDNMGNKHQELQDLNSASAEVLEVSRNKNGELVAKMASFETQKTKEFLQFASRDSLTLELQKEVKEMKKYLKKQGSVTQFSTGGSAQTTTNTTVINNNTDFPTYKSSFNLGGWVFGESVASKDSTYYDIGYTDEYSLTIGVEPTGFLGLGKGKPFGEVTSSNPYNIVKTMKTYQVAAPKRKMFSLAPSINLGYDFGGLRLTAGASLQLEKLAIKF